MFKWGLWILKIKRLHKDAVWPTRAKQGDAGFDLTAISMEYDQKTDTVVYEFGLSIQVPKGHFGMIVPRSSIYKTNMMLSNHCGIIDSGYTGPIKAIFRTFPTYKNEPYKVGDRVAQLILVPYYEPSLEEVDELDETERGDGGFGHSGR